jgi:hypothetical protein
VHWQQISKLKNDSTKPLQMQQPNEPSRLISTEGVIEMADEEKDQHVESMEVNELEDKDLDDASGGYLDWNCGCSSSAAEN